jgi:galactosamine-6-phosphate isomerase
MKEYPMHMEIVKDYSALSEYAGRLLLEAMRETPRGLFCLAAGDTPRGAYDILARRLREESVDTSECDFVGLDEWVGLSGGDQGGCRTFLDETLFGPLRISGSRVAFFDGKAQDLEGECARIDSRIEAGGPLDFVVLGIGMNGHLGFNEPGTPLGVNCHVVKLDATTRSIGSKYFHARESPGLGLTVGLGQLLAAKRILALASGGSKAGIVARSLREPPTLDVPSSALQGRPQVIVCLDEEAAGGMGSTTD